MPLCPQYSWEESEKALTVVLTAPGLSKAKTDLLISDLQVRISCQPYLLQLDLRHEVDEARCSATFGASQLSLRLSKAVAGIWGELTAQGAKADLQNRRNDSLHRLEARLQAEQQAKLQQKQNLDKDATDRRIELDRQKRDAIEKMKKQELDAERNQVASWQSNIAATDGGESDYEDDGETASANTAKDHEQYHGRGYQQGTSTQEHDPNGVLSASQTRHADQQQQKGTLPENIWANQPAVVTDAVSPVNEAEQESCSTEQQHFRRQDDTGIEVASHLTAPVRTCCQPVQVSFTQLETDHLPARETREQEISAHKAQAKVHQAQQDDVDMSERQPMFLKDKGDSLYKAGNYRAALNAYTKALKLDASLTACYCNRGLTHLKLQDYRSCIIDMTTALAQLGAVRDSDLAQSSPAGAALNNMLVKVLVRRAAAHSQLLDLPAAASDLTQALKLRPNDKQLRLDVSGVQACLSAVDSTGLKSMGDQRFKGKDLQGAAEAYTVVLDLTDATAADRLAAASNRAACYLAQAQYSHTVADCNLAFGLLTGQDTKAPHVHTWLNTQGAQQMTDQQQQSLARLLARRGVAQGHLHRYNAAVLDLQAAQSIYTSTGDATRAAALEADMQKMGRLAAGNASTCS